MVKVYHKNQRWNFLQQEFLCGAFCPNPADYAPVWLRFNAFSRLKGIAAIRAQLAIPGSQINCQQIIQPKFPV